MTELYPSPVPGHSRPPNLQLAHNIAHNPYPSHPIYQSSNIMQIPQTMAPPTTLSNIQPSSPLSNIQNLSQSGMTSYNKDNNDNNVSNSNGSQHQGYATNTTGMVTILGPNSGNFTIPSVR